MMNWLRGPWVIALLLTVATYIGYASIRPRVSIDSYWSLPVAESLLLQGDTNLDEYRAGASKARRRLLVAAEAHHYNFFPLGPSLAAVPFVAFARAAPNAFLFLAPRARDEATRIRGGAKSVVAFRRALEGLVAGICVALSVGFLYLALAARCVDRRWALLTAIVYAFGSSAVSSASRGLWQHGPNMLFLSFALWLLVRGWATLGESRIRRNVGTWWFFFAGLSLACAYLCRPTSAVPLFLVGAVLAWKNRKLCALFLAGAFTVLVPFGLYSYLTYGHLLPPYYYAGRLSLSASFVEALAGNLVSPGRGLLVYSPIVLLMPLAIWQRVKVQKFTALDGALLVAVVLHWVTVSLFPHWWGGQSVGSRMMSDVLPFVFFFEGQLTFPRLNTHSPRLVTALLCVGILIAASVAINLRAAISPAVQRWNAWPKNIDRRPERLWSWQDPPFLRGNRVAKKYRVRKSRGQEIRAVAVVAS